jgi:hypothetical protein
MLTKNPNESWNFDYGVLFSFGRAAIKRSG